jgi:hypothetical protein
LRSLDVECEAALRRIRDRVTRAHLEDIRARIGEILDREVSEG